MKKVKEKHLLIKPANKFNKYKHKKCTWITTDISEPMKLRNNLYKAFNATLSNLEVYGNLKKVQTHNYLLRKNVRLVKTKYYN